MKTRPSRAGIVRVKICGITSWADAKTAIEAGADALGFNFYAKSPRRIAISHAREIIRHIPHGVSAVGVFVNAPETEVLRIAKRAKLSVLQLHGNESPRTVERLARHYPVIKAFRAGPFFTTKELGKYDHASGFLLDGFDPKIPGGTGKPFDWQIARRAKQYGPVILAGGLTKKNVARAIREVTPFAVDVCGGVEASPGKKDPRKVRDFMAAARGKQARAK